MPTKTLALLAALVVSGGLVILAVMSYYVYSNAEIRLRNQIEAKQQANTVEFDQMWKNISQAAQVTTAQKDALKEIFVGYAQARTGTGENHPIVNWIHEAIPNVDTTTFSNLQNIIVGARNHWTERQVELVDLAREHHNCLTLAPSSWVVGSRPAIVIKLVTSTKTEAAFDSGKDDDTKLFVK